MKFFIIQAMLTLWLVHWVGRQLVHLFVIYFWRWQWLLYCWKLLKRCGPNRPALRIIRERESRDKSLRMLETVEVCCLLIWFGQIWVSYVAPQTLDEAHKSKFLIHASTTKMYRHLHDDCWWAAMKKDVAHWHGM